MAPVFLDRLMDALCMRTHGLLQEDITTVIHAIALANLGAFYDNYIPVSAVRDRLCTTGPCLGFSALNAAAQLRLVALYAAPNRAVRPGAVPDLPEPGTRCGSAVIPQEHSAIPRRSEHLPAPE